MKNRCFAPIGFIILSICGILAGCGNGNPTPTNSPTQFSLIEPGVITIGADAAYPPHTYLDPNTQEIVGFDVDLASEIGNRLGLEIRFVPIEWRGIIPALQGGRIDLITAEMHITPERQEVINFSDVVFSGGHVIVVRSSTSNIHTPDDLSNKIVLVPTGTTEEELARQFTDEVITYPLLSECFRQLELGRGDAVIVELSVASYYVLNSENALKIVTAPLTQVDSAFAFRMDNESDRLREAFNNTLTDMRDDGTYDEIYTRWIAPIER